LITVRIARIGLNELEKDTTFKVLWARGPESHTSSNVDLNEFEIDADMQDVMTKQSSFYTKDHVTYEPKWSTFTIVEVTENEGDKEVAKTDINMAQFVNHTNAQAKISFASNRFAGLFLDVIWTIIETKDVVKNSSI
jgi:hypothetical protein